MVIVMENTDIHQQGVIYKIFILIKSKDNLLTTYSYHTSGNRKKSSTLT